MGIITTGPIDHHYKKIKQLRLKQWIPTESFDLAIKKFSMIAEHTLCVGDSFENEKATHLHEVTSFEEQLQIIQSLFP